MFPLHFFFTRGYPWVCVMGLDMHVSLWIDKSGFPRLRSELGTQYENDILLLIFVRKPWERDMSRSVLLLQSPAMGRFKFPVPYKERTLTLNYVLSVDISRVD